MSYIRTAFLYLVLITVIRLMGKRQIGQMEPAEFVVTMLVANLASIPMQDGGIPLLTGIVPILTILGVELMLSNLSLHSLRLRRWLCGKPVILIENGKILHQNLRRTSVTLDELMGHLRQKDVLDIQQVQYTILETDGNFSVFPYPQFQPANADDAGITPSRQHLPVTLIADGQLLKENLLPAKKTADWIHQVLREKNATIASTLLLMVDESGQITFYPKEVEK